MKREVSFIKQDAVVAKIWSSRLIRKCWVLLRYTYAQFLLNYVVVFSAIWTRTSARRCLRPHAAKERRCPVWPSARAKAACLSGRPTTPQTLRFVSAYLWGNCSPFEPNRTNCPRNGSAETEIARGMWIITDLAWKNSRPNLSLCRFTPFWSSNLPEPQGNKLPSVSLLLLPLSLTPLGVIPLSPYRLLTHS